MKMNLKLNQVVLTDIMELAQQLVGSRTFFIGILDEDFSVLKVYSKENGSKITEGMVFPIVLSVCNLVTCEGPVVINNTKLDTRTSELETIYEAKVGSYLGTPIVLENGTLFGTFCAVDPNPYEFSKQEVINMQHLSNILATIIFKHQGLILPEIEEKILKLDKLALVGQLAAGLAHEIRNPMQSVKGFIQLLLTETELTDNYKRIVLSDLDRINELIGDFLLVTQPSAPKMEKTCVVNLIQSTLELMKSEANQHNIDILFKDFSEIPEIEIDPSQIKQVIINIMKNAIEAIGENGQINIGLCKTENWLVIKIKDNGPGIPLSIINKVGNPFFSTKDEGVGLGLSICKTIMKEHKGKINIENGDDGTVVIIRLPITIKESI